MGGFLHIPLNPPVPMFLRLPRHLPRHLTLTPPGQHAQRIERSVGSMAGRRHAVLASLPYALPLRYEV